MAEPTTLNPKLQALVRQGAVDLKKSSSRPPGSGALVRKPRDISCRPADVVCTVCGTSRQPAWNEWDGRWVMPRTCIICEGRQTVALAQAVTRRENAVKLRKHLGLDVGEFAHMRLDTYQPKNTSQEQALAAAQHFVADLKTDRWWPGLMLLSVLPTVGVGKTHLMVGILAEALPYVDGLEFVDVPSLVGELKGSFSTGGTQALINHICTVDLLMLDDLGAEMVARSTGDDNTTWWADTVYQIMNRRMTAARCTVITTNLAQPSLLQRYGARTVSRMLSMTNAPVILTGKDGRFETWGWAKG